jgi:hypothetical protein
VLTLVLTQHSRSRHAAKSRLARVDVFVIDDSTASAPSRPGMGPMVGVGGLHVPSASVKRLERALDDLCERTGFPTGEEFKWSPQRGAWMRDGLVEDARREFFRTALALARSVGATTIAVAPRT